MIRVGVFGALGKMGRTVCETVTADPELALVAAVDPAAPGTDVCGVAAADKPRALLDAGAQVAVDFTRPDVVMEDVRFCLANGVHAVVGTTGLGPEQLDEIRALCARHGTNAIVAPNFALGAILAIEMAKVAARYFGSCEVVELHHNEKLDAPSGTAMKTAREIADVWARHGRPPGGEPTPGEKETVAGARGADVGGVHVHAVRLRGLVAHEEILFGGQGQLLSIRHDSIDRSSFMPGVVMAVKAVAERPGLTYGLEHLLELGGDG